MRCRPQTAVFIFHFSVGWLHDSVGTATNIQKTSTTHQYLAAFIQAVNEIRLCVAFDFDQKFQEHVLYL